MTRHWLEVKLTDKDVRNYWTRHEKLLEVTDNSVRS